MIDTVLSTLHLYSHVSLTETPEDTYITPLTHLIDEGTEAQRVLRHLLKVIQLKSRGNKV